MTVLNELFEITKDNLYIIGPIAFMVIMFVIGYFDKPRKPKEKPIVHEEKKGTPGWIWIMLLLLAFIGWQLYVSNTKPTTRAIILATPTARTTTHTYVDEYEVIPVPGEDQDYNWRQEKAERLEAGH